MNGVEVASRLRAGTIPAPRIVVVTSSGQNEAEAAFAGAEVSALVLKPVSATSPAAAIAEMESGPARIREPVVAAPTRRLDGLRVLLVDDVETNRLVASEILIDQGAVVVKPSTDVRRSTRC